MQIRTNKPRLPRYNELAILSYVVSWNVCVYIVIMASIWTEDEYIKLVEIIKNYPVISLWQTDHAAWQKGTTISCNEKGGN